MDNPIAISALKEINHTVDGVMGKGPNKDTIWS